MYKRQTQSYTETRTHKSGKKGYNNTFSKIEILYIGAGAIFLRRVRNVRPGGGEHALSLIHIFTTSYGSNSAKQLEETIRSATETTPETITAYSYDAAGRKVSTRRDIGAMTTVEGAQYDDCLLYTSRCV